MINQATLVGTMQDIYNSEKAIEHRTSVVRWYLHIFSNQKSQFGKILEGLATEDVGIFYGHFVYFTSERYIFGHSVHFVVIWYIFPSFCMLYREKSGNPASDGIFKLRFELLFKKRENNGGGFPSLQKNK
jgi:hypothetical protein